MPEMNAVFAALSHADNAALRPHLKSVQLHQTLVLFEAGEPISAVYFPTTAVISLVVTLSTGEVVEAAMVGKDGVVGAASAIGARISLCRAIVQLGGSAFMCDPDTLRSTALQSHSLLSILIRHEQAVYGQAQQSAACMATHDVQSRLCRWLLRARDLSGSDDLPFTQEFLAEMLGVRRTSVTTVALTLQQAGLIKYARGKIHVLDTDGLRDAACECYEAVRTHYTAVMAAP
jgi:CRP-like cAMP-binding protein